jgi:hypothetical protein
MSEEGWQTALDRIEEASPDFSPYYGKKPFFMA